MKQFNKYLLAVIGFYLLCYILPLGASELLVPDETRYAEIPREMIHSGDWLVPRFDGVRYFEKPVLGYWAHAASILLFGENAFAVRLPSALSVGLTALLVFWLVCRFCPGSSEEPRSSGILAAIIFLSCFEVYGVGNFAVLDSLFSFLLSATIILFYFSTEEAAGSAREKRFLWLSGVFCALAFLTKGFLAFAVPVIVLTPYLLWQRRGKELLRMSWLPVLIAILVILPWGLMIQLREPDFWHFFFWNEHIRRFLEHNAQHRHSFWYLFAAAPGMFMPWTFMVPGAVAGVRQPMKASDSRGRLLRFSLCWLVMPFLFFSFSSGKLMTYILPCFPPFAVLMALGLWNLLSRENRHRYFQLATAGAVLLLGLALLGFLYVQFSLALGFPLYSQAWQVLVAVLGLIFFIALCIWARKSRSVMNKVLLFALAPLLLFSTAHLLLPDRTLDVRAPGRLLARYGQHFGPDTIIISDKDSIGAVCWFLHRSDVYVVGNAGELGYGFSYPDAAGRRLDLPAVVDLIHRHRGDLVLVARRKHFDKWRNLLPKPESEVGSGPKGYVICRY